MVEFKSESDCLLLVQESMNMFLDEIHASEEPSDQSQTTDDNSEVGSVEDKDSAGITGSSEFLKRLQRCGKSCRLRWINYLRPDLKRGTFSMEEDNLIIELHAVLGSKQYAFQSEAGKKIPFILVINLQVPARPNYSLVLYYAADRPVNNNSLLGKFVNGTDMFRDSRFKLIPSIVEGYWMVKRAVGTKACLLGKAVTCKYIRQDNFLEIDVDIGSSSVARSVIGLVLGYVTSIVVDLAILIEVFKNYLTPVDLSL